MIEVKNIEKSFGDTKVLKGITTTFETGKTNLIIGQSGSGKTVLLKSLLGIHTPEVCTMSFDGRISVSYTHLDVYKRQLQTRRSVLQFGLRFFDYGNCFFKISLAKE